MKKEIGSAGRNWNKREKTVNERGSEQCGNKI